MVFKKKFNQDPQDLKSFDEDDINDSDELFSDGEKEFLDDFRNRYAKPDFDSDEEVLKIGNDDDDNDKDSMESDIERPQDEDDEIPDERAWGQKKRAYYSTDYVDPDYSSLNQKDRAAAELEEQEARNIQKRLAEQMDDADFGLDLLQVSKDLPEEIEKREEAEEETIKTDLTKLSKRQLQVLFQKENPEFQALVDDFKERLKELKNILLPFLRLMKRENISEDRAVDFVKMKYQLILNYCSNVSFYLVLKAKKIPIVGHPIIKRLAQYRQFLTQLDEGQGSLLDDIAEILDADQAGKSLYNVSDRTKLKSKKKLKDGKKKKLKSVQFVEEEHADEVEDKESELDGDENVGAEEMEGEIDDEMDVETQNEVTEFTGDQKRPITYQIAKNKGLTPRRSKEQRNPRVKHRNKYRKAKIRRKGAVREVRKEIKKYSGEISGIKAGVKKSIKLK